jgi:taurine dioxygenase
VRVTAEVHDLDLTDVSDEQVDGLRRLLVEHGVLVVPGQDALDAEGLAAVLRRLGDGCVGLTSPEGGGEALFTDRCRAYETLPSDIRMHLAGRTVTDAAGEHPVFRRHPVTGRTALHLAAPDRDLAMSDMDRGAARQTLGYLHEHASTEDNTVRHAWSHGDVLIWDDGCVLHRGTVAG